jgi:hypothetical protein
LVQSNQQVDKLIIVFSSGTSNLPPKSMVFVIASLTGSLAAAGSEDV